MWTRIPVCCVLVALLVSAPALVRAESKAAFVVLLFDGHEAMAGSEITEPMRVFAGELGKKSFDDVLVLCRVHKRYKKSFGPVDAVEASDNITTYLERLKFDGSVRNLGGALSFANGHLAAPPHINKVRVIVLIHGGGDDGSSGLLATEINRAKEGDVAIHTIAFGDTVDRTLLKKLSKQTDGRYYQVASVVGLPAALTKVMENIDRARKGESFLAQEKFGRTKNEKKRVDDRDSDGDAEDKARKRKRDRKRKKTRRSRKSDNEDDDDDEDNDDEAEDEETSSAAKKSGDSSAWVWILILILVLAGGAAGVVFFLRRRGAVESHEEPQYEDAPDSDEFDASSYFAGAGGGPPPEPAAPEPAASEPQPMRREEPRQAKGGSSSVVFEPCGGEGERFEMGARATVIQVGRKAKNDVTLVHNGVSGRHAVLRWDDGVVTLTDLESTNGTFVNGNRITECVLESGDQVRFDAISFQVTYGTPPAHDELASAPVEGQDRTMMLSEEQILAMTPAAEDESPEVGDEENEAEPIHLEHVFCLRHKNRISQQSCDVCNRPYCSECLVSVVDQQICNKCRVSESNA